MINLWKLSTFVLGSALAVTVGTSAVHRASAATADPAPQSIAEKQPHMVAALEALKTARTELAIAAEDKGGHRAAALAATDVAIKQTKDGIEFANKN
jgi:hypothetical protein